LGDIAKYLLSFIKNETRPELEENLAVEFFVNVIASIARPKLSKNTRMFPQSSRFVLKKANRFQTWNRPLRENFPLMLSST